MMTDQQFRALLNLFMCSDPFPVSGGVDQKVIEEMLDGESKRRGHENWVVAFHEFKVT